MKTFLGKILGEVYRIQRHLEMPNSVDDATAYGLLNGIEDEIDEQLEHVGFISSGKIEIVVKLLDEYHQSEEKLKALAGFYEIEPKLSGTGVSRADVMRICRYLRANDRFVEVIDKASNSNYTPVELKNPQIRDSDI